MENKDLANIRFHRKRKMLLVLPLIVVPFLTIGFKALGGGKAGEQKKQDTSTGLNVQLPEAHLKDDPTQNKMSFYEWADKDSLNIKKNEKDDPFYARPYSQRDSFSFSPAKPTSFYPPTDSLKGFMGEDPNEARVYQKLAQLEGQLNVAQHKDETYPGRPISYSPPDHRSIKEKEYTGQPPHSSEAVYEPNNSSEDPEMKSLNHLMDKVLDIQHPERVSQRHSKAEENDKGIVYQVSPYIEQASVSLLYADTMGKQKGNGFFGTGDSITIDVANSIKASAYENQTIVNGAVVKFTLDHDLLIGGEKVPKGNFVFGLATLSGDRLKVDIRSIRKGGNLFPVHLQAYDLDGLEGIYVPNAITRETAKSSVDQAAQMLQISSLDPSLKVQAASAGIDVAKNMLQKKVKLVKVTLKAGYKVLLYNESIRQ